MPKRTLLAPLLAFSLMAASPHDSLKQTIANTWAQLPESTNSCPNFDYFPNGGMQNFYCHVANYLPYDQLQHLLGVKAFIKGPHGQSILNLEADHYFGYYNPEFVKALAEHLIPGSQDQTFRVATQKVYDTTIAPLARIHWVTYQKLQKESEFYHHEVQTYRQGVEENRLPTGYYEKYFYFMNPNYPEVQSPDLLMDQGFDGGWDGNIVQTATAFWIRRTIDGTAPEFAAALKKLLTTYDQAFLADPTAVSGT